MSRMRAVVLGIGLAMGARALLGRVLVVKMRRDLQALNDGDHLPMLANYADDAVLRFSPGEHRWAGEHRGKPEIGRFLRNFTAAGLHGEVPELVVSGPPWRMTVFARFDDGATTPAGEELYRNRAVLLLRMRWGRVVEHEDFFVDTARIEELEARLRERGV